jgi:chromate transporter
MQKLKEVAGLFLKMGTIAFGGPAAHIAIMHDETVKKRKWLNDQQFLDLVGATNLIPGPNSTEMAIHIGFLRAGWRGLITAGVCFIVPAMLIVLLLAHIYVRFGATPQAKWLLYGIKPVVVAIIIQALWNLGRKAVKGWLTAAAGLIVLSLNFVGVNEIALLFSGGLAVMFLVNLQRLRKGILGIFFLPLGTAGILSVPSAPFGLPLLFLTFLKIGAVLYGSGYVLLAFLRADLVTRFGWLTDHQLIDAISVGQITPGPLFTTATFIGYILGGVWGAILATLAIFLPSFIFVAVSNPLIPRMRSSAWFSGLLDGVNVSSLALMAAVTWQIGRTSLVDMLSVTIAFVSFVLLIRFKINSTWLILGGALLGFLRMRIW